MLAQAAELLDVSATLEVDDGKIRSRDTNRSVSYEEIQGNKPFEIDVDLNVDVTTHRIVGKDLPLALEMVTGEYRP